MISPRVSALTIVLVLGGAILLAGLNQFTPVGSALHRPDRLFDAADASGRTVELDWACRAEAVRTAYDLSSLRYMLHFGAPTPLKKLLVLAT